MHVRLNFSEPSASAAATTTTTESSEESEDDNISGKNTETNNGIAQSAAVVCNVVAGTSGDEALPVSYSYL